jgi:hypothetical protein
MSYKSMMKVRQTWLNGIKRSYDKAVREWEPKLSEARRAISGGESETLYYAVVVNARQEILDYWMQAYLETWHTRPDESGKHWVMHPVGPRSYVEAMSALRAKRSRARTKD